MIIQLKLNVQIKTIQKMKNQFIIPAMLLALLLGFTSCKKEDTTAPTVEIESPANNSTYSVGETIDVHIDIEEDVEMHQTVVTTTNEATSDVVDTQTFDNHDTDQHVDYELEVAAGWEGAELHIEVEATDEAGNTGSAHIDVVINQ